jgi:large subunit ribosomal protein L7/L12
VNTQQDLDQIVETLSNLSVLDMSKLKTLLEKKWDVKAAAQAVMMGPATNHEEKKAAVVEATEFNVVLESITGNKIEIIKLVREVTALGLKEAKDLVDGIPQEVKQKVSKADAENIQKKFETAGAKVVLKPL